MKVYFYDGNVMFIENAPAGAQKIDAVNGYSRSLKIVEDIRKFYPTDNFSIITNCPWFMSNEYCWNVDEKKPDIYLWSTKSKSWKNITEFTEKEIKYAHNIEKMWRAGTFEE